MKLKLEIMALKIGFAGTYYTLWSVDSEPVYATLNGQNYQSGIKTNFCYFKNLSKDLSEAQTKAAAQGCEDMTPDAELRGQKRFSRYTSFTPEVKEVLSEDVFKFGKYRGTALVDCTDFDYLAWYAKDSDSKIAQELIVKYKPLEYCFYFGEFMSVQDKKGAKNFRKLLKAAKAGESYSFLCERNIIVNGGGEDCLNDFIVDDFRCSISKKQAVKVLSYQGYYYGLPDGNRIKGNEVKVTFDAVSANAGKLIIDKIELT